MTTNTSSQEETESDHVATDSEHLDEIPDGCGCTEIWEHLSENRSEVSDK